MSKEKEAMFYTPLPDGKLKCNLCGRRCVVADGASGVCQARTNKRGVMYTTAYGRSCSSSVDPIEKKPLFHFHPGARVFSVASPFCNFFCRFCDNWVISQQRSAYQTNEMSPSEVVETAQRYTSEGISYTYTEPTTFYEWAYESARLAHAAGLFNTFVTNGYMSPEAAEAISPYLDAATVDFKGAGDPKFYAEVMRVPSVEPIYACLAALKKHGVHIEITNLIVPEYGDSEQRLRELALWIQSNLGPDTPLHILRFYPSYELIDVPPTPIGAIERGVKAAQDTGLRYVYAGNVPGHDGENTYCPKCRNLVVKRSSFEITGWNLTKDMKCTECGEKIPIKGQFHGQVLARGRAD